MIEPPKIRVQKGWVICYTGDGKGKTTAALGLCVRATGYNLRTLIWQFIKGSWKYGELEGIKHLAPYVELRQKGEGFVGIVDDKKPREVHRQAALRALEEVKGEIASGEWNIVILDEIFVGCQLKFLTADDLLELIAVKPAARHVRTRQSQLGRQQPFGRPARAGSPRGRRLGDGDERDQTPLSEGRTGAKGGRLLNTGVHVLSTRRHVCATLCTLCL